MVFGQWKKTNAINMYTRNTSQNCGGNMNIHIEPSYPRQNTCGNVSKCQCIYVLPV